MKRSFAFAAAVAAAVLGAGTASALTVPFTEDFDPSSALWEDNAGNPLVHHAAGGLGGGGYVSTEFNYFGFTSPFGGGPVIFRANDNDNASGDAFVGNWVTGGVVYVSAWFYHETGVDLVPFMRVASSFNFPGAVINQTAVVPSDAWTQVVFAVDPAAVPPECIGETVTCAAALASVGNLQFGTDAPASLVATDQSYFLAIDKVTVSNVPEPTQAVLLGSGLAGLAVLGRRRLSP